jgi:hypothetical protein
LNLDPATERQIAQQAYRAGQPLPESIANAPELQLGLMVYLQAFFELDTERSNGFGPGHIPISRIREYCCDWEFNAEETEDCVYLIRQLDCAYFEWYGKKRESDAANAKRSS